MKNFLKSIYQFFSINLEVRNTTILKDWGNIIIATKRGLYQLANKKLKLVRLGEFYGVTIIKNDLVYVLNKVSEKESMIVSFQLVDGIINKSSMKIIFRNLDDAIHQIDYFNKALYLTDTHNNRIITTNLSGENMKYHYPIGKATKGRESSNYGHINSIFSDSKYIYILCHNNSVKTNKNSEVIVTDFNFNLIKKISTSSESAHNIIKYKGDIYHCDSLNSKLKRNNDTIFIAEEFTRGLAITNDDIILGDSSYAKRAERKNSKGHIYLLDHDGSLKERINIPGMVQEIRRIDKVDYGLSLNNTAK